MASNPKQTWPNIGYMRVQQLVVDNLEYKKLDIANPLTMGAAKLGLVLHRLEYWYPRTVIAALGGVGEFIYGGVGVANTMTAPGPDDAEVVDMFEMDADILGAVVSKQFVMQPIVHDYSLVPGGGLLVPADRLFLFAMSGGLAATLVLECRFYYTPVELSAEDYWQLVEARHLLTT